VQQVETLASTFELVDLPDAAPPSMATMMKGAAVTAPRIFFRNASSNSKKLGKVFAQHARILDREPRPAVATQIMATKMRRLIAKRWSP